MAVKLEQQIKAPEVVSDVTLTASQALMNAEKVRKELLKVYKAEEKVNIYLSPMYKPYFGAVMQVMINGISIFFKVDGSTQNIPTTFADEVTRRRMAIDDIINKHKVLADIGANSENSPGELQLV